MTQLSDRYAAAPAAVTLPAPGRWRRLFAFPNPVNEYAARCTAGIVVLLSLLAVLTGQRWLVAVIAVGFVLRVACGPRLSPAALLSVRLLAPLFGPPKLVPGPPKRFAQGLGAVLSGTAFVLLSVGAGPAGWTLLLLLIVAASLESFVGLCFGCLIFGALQRRGLLPRRVCEDCAA